MTAIPLPPVVERDAWLTQVTELRKREKAATKQLDALAAERRRLPMTEVPNYTLHGANGPVKLSDVFEGHSQLIIYAHMWKKGDEWQCPGCTTFTSHFSSAGILGLDAYDAKMIIVADAPIEDILAYKEKVHSQLPYYSIEGTDYVKTVETTTSMFGLNVFLKDGDKVYQTWGTSHRGVEPFLYLPSLADILPYGRQEEWETSPKGWPQYPTYSRGRNSAGIAADAKKNPQV